MYSLISIENICLFLNNFGLDFELFSSFEQAVVIILCNISYIIFWYIFISFFYKLVCRVLRFI